MKHIKLIYVDSKGSNNNNKVWQITINDNDSLLVEWGRVGKKLQSKTHPFGGEHKANTLINAKKRKGYNTIETLDNQSSKSASDTMVQKAAKKQIKTKSRGKNKKIIDQLIETLVKENIHEITSKTAITYNQDTGLFSTPLGIVTLNSINNASKILTKISKYVEDQKFTSRLIPDLIDKYLILIPHDVGMKKPTIQLLFPNLKKIDEEFEILSKLKSSYEDYEEQVEVDTPEIKEKLFDLELSVAPKKIVDYVKEKYQKTRKDAHVCNHLKVKQVYIIKSEETEKQFDHKKDNIMELWHGSTKENLLSILKSGIRINPPTTARIAGKMFGHGAYFASDSTKSLNYSYGYWHGNTNRNCFMFLADIAMGNYYIPSGQRSSPPPKGYDSYWAKSGRSRVRNDEFVVFNQSQIKLKYLVEVG